MKQRIIENEEARLNALRSLNLLDTPPSENFDRITRMTSRLLGTPVAAITLVDRDRLWFKSQSGFDIPEFPRRDCPCDQSIRTDQIFIVDDLAADPDFANSPMTAGGYRFYAGAPLITPSGYALGTLCVLDTKPRAGLSADEREVLCDLTALVMNQIELESTLGLVDPTTGLPNEHRFYADAVELASREPDLDKLALMVELVSQQQISHGLRVLGAKYAEELVRNAAQSIRTAAGDGASVYHVGHARCLVLLEEPAEGTVGALIDTLGRSLRHTILSSGIPVAVDPAIGASSFRVGSLGGRDLLRRLYNAVDDARRTASTVAFYDEQHDRDHARSFALLTGLHRSLDTPGELSLVYQQIVDLPAGHCTGAEALLRWRHPELGPVNPGEFIPLVERTGMISDLTDWVAETAIAQIAAWRRGGAAPPKLSINVSARNLDEKEFVARLAERLGRHAVEPAALQLEFTESALFRDTPRAQQQLEALQQLGVSIAIDDFGTGYSSLSYLQNLPARVIKIDQTFIRRLASSDHDRTLVRAMIDLCHDLGFRVTAEGIEDKRSLERLIGWGCDEGQGFHIARPMSGDELAAWLSGNRQD